MPHVNKKSQQKNEKNYFKQKTRPRINYELIGKTI